MHGGGASLEMSDSNIRAQKIVTPVERFTARTYVLDMETTDRNSNDSRPDYVQTITITGEIVYLSSTERVCGALFSGAF